MKPCKGCRFIVGRPVRSLTAPSAGTVGLGGPGIKGCGHVVLWKNGSITSLPSEHVVAAACQKHSNFDANCSACNQELVSSRVLNVRDGRVLYAIVLEVLCGSCKWKPHGIEYTYATSGNEAIAYFRRSNPSPRIRIVGVSPSVGYHAEDEHGDRLTV